MKFDIIVGHSMKMLSFEFDALGVAAASFKCQLFVEYFKAPAVIGRKSLMSEEVIHVDKKIRSFFSSSLPSSQYFCFNH